MRPPSEAVIKTSLQQQIKLCNAAKKRMVREEEVLHGKRKMYLLVAIDEEDDTNEEMLDLDRAEWLKRGIHDARCGVRLQRR